MDEAYDRNLQRARRMALLAVIPPTLLMLVLVVVASALAGTPLLLLVLLLPLALGAYGIYRGAQITPQWNTGMTMSAGTPLSRASCRPSSFRTSYTLRPKTLLSGREK